MKFVRKVFAVTVRLLSRGWGLSRFRIVKKLHNFFLSMVKDADSVADVNGFKMHLDDKDSLRLSVFGIYEAFETELVKKEVKRGDRVADLGANIGYYTLLFSRLVGDEGRVFAFEPDPGNFSILEKNVKKNDCRNVVLERKAVGDENGTATLYLSEENRGDHRIVVVNGETRKSVSVPMVTLESYFKNEPASPNFIKMDIQGAEMKALAGMLPLLKKNGVRILIEYWPRALCGAGSNPLQLLFLLRKNGFEIHEVSDVHKQFLKIGEAEEFLARLSRTGGATNLFCFKK